MFSRSPVRKSAHRVGAVTLLAFVMAFMLLAIFPHQALADDYSIEQVDIDATVNPDGSVDVLEWREFDFDGSFHGVYWQIPTGSYGNRSIETTITSVGEMIDGEYVPFEESYAGEDHTFQLYDYSSYIEVKLYSAHYDESAVFVIGYNDSNLAVRHDDVSELYWKFVSDGWDVESKNVTCTVHLPVPEGKKVEPEENVRAWGHGPLDGNVAFDDNDVVYTVPGVGTSEFAEARITFPADWLNEASSQGDRALQDILAEERAWADEANARRQRARIMTFGGALVGVLASLAMLVSSIAIYARYRRLSKPMFDDKYFRDVPSNDHPAVLGALWRGGKPEGEDFTATLMRLTDLGLVKLDLVTVENKGFLGKVKTTQDYRLTLIADIDQIEIDRIDDKAIRMLFHTVYRAIKSRGDADTGEVSILFSDLEKVAKKYPERFDSAYDNWEQKVTDEVGRRRFFVSETGTGFGAIVALGVLDIALMMGTVFMLIITEAVGLFLLVLAAEALALVMLVIFGSKIQSMSSEARELKAKLEALRRWLKDFTRLNEAIPRDVILWNRLLVMAVVLGVAEEVIEQLQVYLPEVLSNPALYRTYGWYYAGPVGRPYNRFNTSYSSAHHVSSAALAASSSSSGGGGGGGFSGGGGGGFGGGGGGGAF